MSQPMLIRSNLVAARETMIVSLAAEAEAAVLNRHPQGGKAGPTVKAFRHLLDGYKAAVEADHTSSQVSWATRDLPKDEADAYYRARHAIELLERVYGDN